LLEAPAELRLQEVRRFGQHAQAVGCNLDTDGSPVFVSAGPLDEAAFLEPVKQNGNRRLLEAGGPRQFARLDALLCGKLLEDDDL
jgi:hypothetical protein